MNAMTFKRYLALFLPHLAAPTYRPMIAVYTIALAQPIDDADIAALMPLLGGRALPHQQVSELWVVAGRASGKTEMAVAFLSYLALCRPWRANPGQVPTGYFIAPTVDISAIAMRFFLGQLRSNSTLSAEIASASRDRVEFHNGTAVEIVAADQGTVRGPSLFYAHVDEIAYLPTSATSASPDIEILAALRPGLARMPGSMLVCISSPYAQQGALFETFRRAYSHDDPHTLVVRGGTLDFNSTFDRDEVARALAEDPERFGAEYLASFRTDMVAFVDAALVDSCTRSEPHEFAGKATTITGTAIQYVAAIDTSGGRSDAAAVAVAHWEDERVVVDAVRRHPSPHDPAVVAEAIAKFLATYGLNSAESDQYAAGFSRSVYAAAGVTLIDAPGTRSDAYLHLLPLLTQGKVELPPDPVLRVELLTLQRRTRPGGRDVVDHRVGSHDDVSNATALAAWAASRMAQTPITRDSFYVVPSDRDTHLFHLRHH